MKNLITGLPRYASDRNTGALVGKLEAAGRMAITGKDQRNGMNETVGSDDDRAAAGR